PIEIDVLLARIRAVLRNRPPRSMAPEPQAAANSVGVPPSVRPTAPESTRPPAGYVGPGMTLDGRFRIESVIGSGGFGTVYRAHHLGLDTTVAVKVLHSHLAASPIVLRRFQLEGISACRVKHRNAVAILDAGTTADGLPYLVMEFLEGRSLLDEIREKHA